MKKRMIYGIAITLLAVSLLMAQEVPSGVIAALQRGNSEELGRFMGNEVSLILPGAPVSTNKKKATELMQTFFADNKVERFDVNHQGNRGDSWFVVGTLTTTAKQKFRVNCFLKKVQNQYVIHQIRIDKIND